MNNLRWVIDFYRDGLWIDQWAFDRERSDRDALYWHNQHFPHLGADEARLENS